MAILSELLGDPAMESLFDDDAQLRALLDFEAALGRAEAAAAVIPPAAAEAISRVAAAMRFDEAARSELAAGAARSGNLAIPLVEALTSAVAAVDAEAARWVHWGATSQDAIDTGLVLQLRRAMARLDGELRAFERSLAEMARAHRRTILAGRSWLQHALPTSFGLKVAGWLDAVHRDRLRLARVAGSARVLQLGGAVGTLASLGSAGPAVVQALARELDLALADTTWHALRDRLVEVGCALGMLGGTLGKIARDLSLLLQTDVGELTLVTAHGEGDSSTMPQKKNPVACAVALHAATRAPGLVATLLAAMPQEHERGLGGWHAEWETVPELFRLVAGSLRHLATMLPKLRVDAARMTANLGITHGLVMAESVSMDLAKVLGRAAAHARVAAASRQATLAGTSLRQALAADDEVTRALPAETLDRALDPQQYLGSAEAQIDAVLERMDRDG
jgi:3-carboxy-cis,cis-muconate cycloisomerase